MGVECEVLGDRGAWRRPKLEMTPFWLEVLD